MLANRFTFGVANVQPCILAQKLYVTKLLLFGQIFATLLAKPMLIWILQYNTNPFMLNKQNKLNASCQPLQMLACLPRGPLCWSRLPGITHVSEAFDVESVFRDVGGFFPPAEQYITQFLTQPCHSLFVCSILALELKYLHYCTS